MEAEIKKCKELGAGKSVEQKQLEGALGIRGSWRGALSTVEGSWGRERILDDDDSKLLITTIISA